jgi:hypothetical protein
MMGMMAYSSKNVVDDDAIESHPSVTSRRVIKLIAGSFSADTTKYKQSALVL